MRGITCSYPAEVGNARGVGLGACLYRIVSCLALVMTLSLSLARPISAQEEVPSRRSIPPQFIRVSTPNYIQEAPTPDVRQFVPPLGTYTFKVGWQGIPAATLTLTTEQRGLYYKINATARTYSGVELFYRLRYQAEGLISALDFSPVRATFMKEENSKQRFTEISFLEDNQVHTVNSGNNRPTEVLQFTPDNQMLEPFSAAFLARSFDWEVGQSRSFDTYVGKTRYLITLTCLEEGVQQVNGEDRPIWVVEPKVMNLTNQKQNTKLRRAFLYVTSDKRREVLKISSEVFIGSVSAWLESFQPAPHQVVPESIIAQYAKRARTRG